MSLILFTLNHSVAFTLGLIPKNPLEYNSKLKTEQRVLTMLVTGTNTEYTLWKD